MLKQVCQISVLRDGPLAIHSFMGPVDGDMVCSQIIETANRVVVVDAQLLRPYARELRDYVNRLGKPLDRVIVSHAHPDHWFGLEAFADVPIYALPETREQISQMGGSLLDYKRKTLGDLRELVAEKAVIPTHELKAGPETIDGVTLNVIKLENSEAPFLAIIELPEQRVLIAQDLVYHNVYPAVGDKSFRGEYLFDGWIGALRDAQTKDYRLILPGHGEPTDAAVLETVIEYVSFAKKLFESGVTPDEFRSTLLGRYPHFRVPEIVDFSVVFLYFRNW